MCILYNFSAGTVTNLSPVIIIQAKIKEFVFSQVFIVKTIIDENYFMLS